MKRFFNRATIFAAVIVFSSTVSFAENTGIGNEYPSLNRGVRALGMGNAFVSQKGTDYNAQFYNPAAINDFEKKHHFLFVNPGADMNTGIINTINDVLDLSDDLDADGSDSEKLDTFDAFVLAHAGDFNHAVVNLPLFHIRHKYYAAGLIVDGRTTISLRNPTFPNFELKSVNDAGIAGGGAYAFFDDSLQVGLNLKVLYRAAIEEQITSNDILNQDLGDIVGWSAWSKGYGVGVDLGTKYALPWWKETLHPTFAVVIQDIADTRFSGGAPKTPMSVSAGGGVFPKFGPVEFGVLADFREINQQQDFLKK
ncbi:MAG: hypothetical protein HY465_03765, partial [Deltaproteobacteria bacterium]|nr:hypothetical protein [Deltaproteobacteria bacterium]